MRLSFPNGEHAEVTLAEGELSIGSAAGCQVMLAQPDIAARHASLRIEPQRGILLHVLDPNAQVHINGRPVREVGLLRLGDVLSLGRVQALLKPDRDAHIEVQVPDDTRPWSDAAQRTAASRVVLRGVGGAFYGRSFSLQDTLLVGSGADAAIRIDDAGMPARAATFEVHGDKVVLRDLGSPDGAVVNGVAVKNAILHPGDQIAFDAHRFVLEAPGLPPRGNEVPSAPSPGARVGTTQTMQAVRADQINPAAANPTKPTPRPSMEPAATTTSSASWLGWLLAAAATIAIALAAAFGLR